MENKRIPEGSNQANNLEETYLTLLDLTKTIQKFEKALKELEDAVQLLKSDIKKLLTYDISDFRAPAPDLLYNKVKPDKGYLG
jgi:hypothetical protein